MDTADVNENEVQSSYASSWWDSMPSWIQSAKEKSATAIEFMKRDLTEFSQVVQTDTVAAVSSTAALLKETLTVDTAGAVASKAKQSVSSVLETLADVFIPQKEIDDTELMIVKDSDLVSMNWFQSQLYLIQKESQTFCHEPEGPPELYENWLESFDLSHHQEEMSQIMRSCSEIKDTYDKLVPTSVSHLEFWQRYFYRVHLLKIAERKREELLQQTDWENDTSLLTSQHPPSNPVTSLEPTHARTEKEILKDTIVEKEKIGENLNSPSESTGKDSNTSEEWEKDFDSEINEIESKEMQSELPKEDEDDWEKW